jgi:excisionase family DNA binding protein
MTDLHTPDGPPAKLTYTVPEAAALLGISRSTAYECVRRGEIPSLTLGRRVLISRSQLERLLGPLSTTPSPS